MESPASWKLSFCHSDTGNKANSKLLTYKLLRVFVAVYSDTKGLIHVDSRLSQFRPFAALQVIHREPMGFFAGHCPCLCHNLLQQWRLQNQATKLQGRKKCSTLWHAILSAKVPRKKSSCCFLWRGKERSCHNKKLGFRPSHFLQPLRDKKTYRKKIEPWPPTCWLVSAKWHPPRHHKKASSSQGVEGCDITSTHQVHYHAQSIFKHLPSQELTYPIQRLLSFLFPLVGYFTSLEGECLKI